jgi:hypothetical protein
MGLVTSDEIFAIANGVSAPVTDDHTRETGDQEPEIDGQPVKAEDLPTEMDEPKAEIDGQEIVEERTPKQPFLAVTSLPMARTSRYPLAMPIAYCSYREELDEVIEYGDTSTDNTETETSDTDKGGKRKSRLPWSRDRATSESKVNQIFSPIDKPTNKLQKKRPKCDLQKNLVQSSVTETSPSEQHLVGRLSPSSHWTQLTNPSQSSFDPSIPSRRSHTASKGSNHSAEKLPPTTFEEMDLKQISAVSLPGKVRAESQNSLQSGESTSKIGQWFRKNRGRGPSVSSSGGVSD